MKSEKMKEHLRAYPMVILLLPLVAAILLCYYTCWPVNLLKDSECESLDSLYSYAFVLKGDPKPTAKCERFDAHLIARWDTAQHAWTEAQGKVLLYVRRDSIMPRNGDTLISRTRIHRGDSIGNFDYGSYLRRQGIIGTAYVSRYSAISCPPSVVTPRPSLQKRLYNRLAAAGLEGDELATVGALTLGYKEDLDPAIRHRFQASGAAHILAVSGLHTAILYGLLIGLFTIGGRIKPRHENAIGRCCISLLIISAMWFYAWLTGMTPSVVRAVLMVTIVEAGRMVYRQTVSVNTIAAAAVLILLVRPLDLWSVSFQLSFAATTAIVLTVSSLRDSGIRLSRRNKLLRYISGILIVSLAAQIGTLPITMYTFGQVSTYFLLTNLIVLPLASLLVPFGMLSIVLGGSGAGVLVSKVTNGLAWLMNHAVGWIESLPGSMVSAQIDGLMIGIYYGLLLLFYILVIKKSI